MDYRCVVWDRCISGHGDDPLRRTSGAVSPARGQAARGGVELLEVRLGTLRVAHGRD